MTYCAQCGTQVTGAYCPQCGAAVNAGSPQADYAPAGASANSGTAAVAAPGMSENVASALCYLLGLITGIIFLALAPYNQNRAVRFHAFQSIFFHVGAIILWIGLMIVMGMFGFLTHGLSVFFSLFLYPLLGLALFITWLYLMYAAYSNKTVVLPIVGPLAQKQA